MQEITYVFKKGRKNKYQSGSIEAKELYYGLPLFSDNYKINVIEFEEEPKNINKKFMNLFDRFMSKFISLPFYTEKILTRKNFRVLKGSKNIILVTESVGCSLLPFLLYLRLFNKTNVSIFIMGLYSKKIRYKKMERIHNFFIKLLIFTVDQVFFLGKGELKKAKKLHKQNDKLIYFPFSVDTDFWSSETINLGENESIIFVGTDSNKDQDLLISIAASFPEIKFLFISNLPKLKNLDMENVEVINGEWGNSNLSDKILREKYLNSRLSIVPLVETYQPSGQSVALQSMSLGLPVIISKTKGFWDEDSFNDNENILFVTDNTPEGWNNIINKAYNDIKLLKEISEKSKETISKYLTLDKFHEKLLMYLK